MLSMHNPMIFHRVKHLHIQTACPKSDTICLYFAKMAPLEGSQISSSCLQCTTDVQTGMYLSLSLHTISLSQISVANVSAGELQQVRMHLKA